MSHDVVDVVSYYLSIHVMYATKSLQNVLPKHPIQIVSGNYGLNRTVTGCLGLALSYGLLLCGSSVFMCHVVCCGMLYTIGYSGVGLLST